MMTRRFLAAAAAVLFAAPVLPTVAVDAGGAKAAYGQQFAMLPFVMPGFGTGGASTTWNPSDKSAGITLSGANLVASGTNNGSNVRSTTSKSSGKWYFEVTATAVGDLSNIGIADAAFPFPNALGSFDAHAAGYDSLGNLHANTNATLIAASTYTTGDVIGVAVDVPNHKIYWSLNGVWQNSAVPASGTGGIDYITTSAIFAAVYFSTSTLVSLTANFGQNSFAHAPPTGFSPWG
jgi:hypothetical protein